MVNSADEDTDASALSATDQDRVTAELDAILGRRAVIEQTKGMLMFVYGIDADAAFELMRAQSQNHNVKLRNVASRISERLLKLSAATDVAGQLPFDVARSWPTTASPTLPMRWTAQRASAAQMSAYGSTAPSAAKRRGDDDADGAWSRQGDWGGARADGGVDRLPQRRRRRLHASVSL